MYVLSNKIIIIIIMQNLCQGILCCILRSEKDMISRTYLESEVAVTTVPLQKASIKTFQIVLKGNKMKEVYK